MTNDSKKKNQGDIDLENTLADGYEKKMGTKLNVPVDPNHVPILGGEPEEALTPEEADEARFDSNEEPTQ